MSVEWSHRMIQRGAQIVAEHRAGEDVVGIYLSHPGKGDLITTIPAMPFAGPAGGYPQHSKSQLDRMLIGFLNGDGEFIIDKHLGLESDLPRLQAREAVWRPPYTVPRDK